MAITPITVEEEFKKNPELKQQDLDSLKDWIRYQAHLPDIPELDLVFFLHSCHFSVELAKHTIETYYTIRTHVPEFFSNRDPSHPTVLSAADNVTMGVLPELSQSGGRVIYTKFYDTNPAHFNFAHDIKYFLMIKDLMLQEYGTSDGFIIVLNFEVVALGHVTRVGLLTLKKILTYVQEAMPLRLKGIHFINPGPYMDKVLSLMKPFLKLELLALIHIHPHGMDSFYQHVEQRILPKELGGTAPGIEEMRKITQNKINANKEFFVQEETRRVTESKRQGKARDAGELFGVEGSFKKLEID